MITKYNEALIKYIIGTLNEGTPETKMGILKRVQRNFVYNQLPLWLKGKNTEGVENGTLIEISRATGNFKINIYNTNMQLLATIPLEERIYSAIIDETGRLIITRMVNNEYKMTICNNITVPDVNGNYFIRYNATYEGQDIIKYKIPNQGIYITYGGDIIGILTIDIHNGTTYETITLPGIQLLDIGFEVNEQNKIKITGYCFGIDDTLATTEYYLCRILKDYEDNEFSVEEKIVLNDQLIGTYTDISVNEGIMFNGSIIATLTITNTRTGSNERIKVIKWNYEWNAIQIIDTINIIPNYEIPPRQAYEVINGVLFYAYLKYKEDSTSTNRLYDEMAYIEDDIHSRLEKIAERSYRNSDIRCIAIMYQYNLLNFYQAQNNLLEQDVMYIDQFSYKKNAYNSYSYESKKMLLPNNIILYNEDRAIFDRNLYNRIIQNNMITNTVEIPNLQLNDETITNEHLMSENNFLMDYKNQEIVKNKYEELFINFNRTINIKNVDEDLLNLQGSIQLTNNTINQDMENKKIAKVRLSDGTVLDIQNIEITNFIVSLDIFIMPTVDITYIDIISEDETMVYTTLHHTYKANKKYHIKEKIRIS